MAYKIKWKKENTNFSNIYYKKKSNALKGKKRLVKLGIVKSKDIKISKI